MNQIANNFLTKNAQVMIVNLLQSTKEDGLEVKLIPYVAINAVVNRIKKLIAENPSDKLSEVIVLYRNNRLSYWLEEGLIASQIPYEILGSYRFIQREEIKDVLAYLRTIACQDDLSFLRVLKFVSGIGAKTLQNIEVQAQAKAKTILVYLKENYSSEEFQKKRDKNLHAFLNTLLLFQEKMLGRGKLSDLVGEILISFAYLPQLADRVEGSEKVKHVQQFLNILRMWERPKKEEFADLQEATLAFLEYCVVTFEDSKLHNQRDNIILSTVHQAKGLEFETVFFVHLDEGILPHKWSELEEEIRLFYVGLTRAKKMLYLFNNSGQPSRFLRQLGLPI